MKNLIETSKEKSKFSQILINGEFVPQFATVTVLTKDRVYNIKRSNGEFVNNYIASYKNGGSLVNGSRWKFYDNVEDFEKALERIQKMEIVEINFN